MCEQLYILSQEGAHTKASIYVAKEVLKAKS